MCARRTKDTVAERIWVSWHAAYQAFPNVRSGMEIASQAEHAGSIPVIGSAEYKFSGTLAYLSHTPSGNSDRRSAGHATGNIC